MRNRLRIRPDGIRNECFSSFLLMANNPDDHSAPEPDSVHLHIEGVGEFKWKWTKAAQKAGLKFAPWVIRSLNEAAAEQDQGDGGKAGKE